MKKEYTACRPMPALININKSFLAVSNKHSVSGQISTTLCSFLTKNIKCLIIINIISLQLLILVFQILLLVLRL